ncbi:MAG: VCBS repeat-containing protein [Planctomycetota bacterium]
MRIRNVFLLFAMVGLPPVSQAQLSFGPEVIIDGTIASGSDIATTDFNNDGLLDLVVIEAVPGLVSQGYVYPGLQGAGFGPRVNLNISSLLAPVAVMVGDFAENGLADVLVIDAFFGDTLLFRNLGGFTFSSGSAGPSPGATADAVATDLNADGHVDFVAALPLSQGGRVYFGTGTGGFTAGPLLAALSVPLSVAVADMNGDTHLDVIFGLNAGAGGGITIRLNNGAAAWTANTFIPGPVGVGTMLPGDPRATISAWRSLAWPC